MEQNIFKTISEGQLVISGGGIFFVIFVIFTLCLGAWVLGKYYEAKKGKGLREYETMEETEYRQATWLILIPAAIILFIIYSII